LHSPPWEHPRLRDRRTRVFKKFLRRAADPVGLAAYTQVLRNGIKEEVVVDSLVGSDEYFKLANQ
jgi:hypothetical protein